MNWDSTALELQKPLDRSKVKPPPQGKYGEYVEAFHVIEEANRIFGNGGFYELGGEIIDASRGHDPPFEAPYRWRQSHQR